MGLNLVWICDKHKKYHTSMRGEEGVDFQALVRNSECKECFRIGSIKVQVDSHTLVESNSSYTEYWPDWEQRPAERLSRGERIY